MVERARTLIAQAHAGGRRAFNTGTSRASPLEQRWSATSSSRGQQEKRNRVDDTGSVENLPQELMSDGTIESQSENSHAVSRPVRYGDNVCLL
jgi:hypothetical protein